MQPLCNKMHYIGYYILKYMFCFKVSNQWSSLVKCNLQLYNKLIVIYIVIFARKGKFEFFIGR